MKPVLLNFFKTTNSPVINNNILVYNGATGNRVKDSGVSIDSLSPIISNSTIVNAHVANDNIHVTSTEKANWNTIYTGVAAHLSNNSIHVSGSDRTNWDEKETTSGAQAKSNIVQSNLNTHINNLDVHVTKLTKSMWDNKYTKEEIDNKFSAYEFGSDWKEAVDSFDDLEQVYPSPYTGWTVNTLDTNITYRFDGADWIAVSANAIPKATTAVDGLMTTTQVIKLTGIETGANRYIHPDDIYTKHVAVDEKTYWNNKAENTTATYAFNGLLSKEDKYKLDGMEEGATNYTHPVVHSPSIIEQNILNRFVTDAEIAYWNAKAPNTLAGIDLNGLMSKEDKIKVNSVEYNANYYIHPATHYPTIIVQDSNNRFVTDAEKISWSAKASTVIVSTVSNGLMLATDKIKLDSVATFANYYIHPEKHDPTIIQTNTSNRFVSDLDIVNWNDKKDSNKVKNGSGVFTANTGTVILHNIGHTGYTVSVTPTSESSSIGQIWVEKENYNIIVKCSGGTTTATFDWIIIQND